jgi:hypothetical protein
MGGHPALPGRQPRFGIARRPPEESRREPPTPRWIPPEISTQDAAHSSAFIFGRDVPRIRRTETASDRGNPFDLVRTLIAIPPKHAAPAAVGFIQGKSAIHAARVHGAQKRRFARQRRPARRDFVSTVEPEEGGPTAAAVEAWRMTGGRQGGRHHLGPRERPQIRRRERFTPGSARFSRGTLARAIPAPHR